MSKSLMTAEQAREYVKASDQNKADADWERVAGLINEAISKPSYSVVIKDIHPINLKKLKDLGYKVEGQEGFNPGYIVSW